MRRLLLYRGHWLRELESFTVRISITRMQLFSEISTAHLKEISSLRIFIEGSSSSSIQQLLL